MAAVADAVIAELAEAGFSNFSIPRVAFKSGISSSSIYRRWATKAELIAFAAVRHSEQAIPIPDLGSLRADLLRLAEEVATFVREPASQALFTIVFGSISPESEAVQNTVWRERTQHHQPIFERALARGEISAGTDVAEIIERLIGPLYIRTFMSRRPITRSFLERLVDSVLADVASHRLA